MLSRPDSRTSHHEVSLESCDYHPKDLGNNSNPNRISWAKLYRRLEGKLSDVVAARLKIDFPCSVLCEAVSLHCAGLFDESCGDFLIFRRVKIGEKFGYMPKGCGKRRREV